MKGAPKSEQFDDVYFSADDGLEETHHVFLKGNSLPEFWNGKDRFTIAETGFGTGLNFLAAWDLMEKSDFQGRLHFLSFELYPLSADQITQALNPWRDVFGDKIDRLAKSYPENPKDHFETKIADCLSLEVHFEDVNDVLPELYAEVDCWFLDGFTPAKNPQMWTDTVFENMARLSKPNATFATFTAAGFVKRGLEQVGFAVEKRKGFGRKRDMLCGCKI